MPELVNSRVGSLPGTSGADGTMVWPLEAKKSRKSRRMPAVLMSGGVVMLAKAGVAGATCGTAIPHDAGAESSWQPNPASLQGGTRPHPPEGPADASHHSDGACLRPG